MFTLVRNFLYRRNFHLVNIVHLFILFSIAGSFPSTFKTLQETFSVAKVSKGKKRKTSLKNEHSNEKSLVLN